MRKFLFADEAGDFEFKDKPNVSRYFIICTITCDTCECGHRLLELRRDLAWNKAPLGDYFHATEDKQPVRDAVFGLIAKFDLRIDATIMEKRKAQPQTRLSQSCFYRYGWFYHLNYLASRILKNPTKELFVTAASIGTKRGQAVFTQTVNNVLQQTASHTDWATYFCQSAADPCLQIADYCAWAIQRKWERQDLRSYDLIRAKIRSEYDLWAKGTDYYY